MKPLQANLPLYTLRYDNLAGRSKIILNKAAHYSLNSSVSSDVFSITFLAFELFVVSLNFDLSS
jgi:hypothetical protein